jgi:hypothetical protein
MYLQGNSTMGHLLSLTFDVCLHYFPVPLSLAFKSKPYVSVLCETWWELQISKLGKTRQMSLYFITRNLDYECTCVRRMLLNSVASYLLFNDMNAMSMWLMENTYIINRVLLDRRNRSVSQDTWMTQIHTITSSLLFSIKCNRESVKTNYPKIKWAMCVQEILIKVEWDPGNLMSKGRWFFLHCRKMQDRVDNLLEASLVIWQYSTRITF